MSIKGNGLSAPKRALDFQMAGRKLSSCIWMATALLLIFLPSLSAHAQYENGSIVGTIHDSTGAAVAGATVTVTNTATNSVATVTTGASGDYEVPSVRVGIYTIKASAPGFSDAAAENITVSVGGRQRDRSLA